MKTQHVTVPQLPVSPAANESTTTMGASPRERPGPDAIADRVFHLLFNHNGIAVIDGPVSEFLAPETALALADLIADDEQLATLITQRETLGGAA